MAHPINNQNKNPGEKNILIIYLLKAKSIRQTKTRQKLLKIGHKAYQYLGKEESYSCNLHN